MLNVCVLVEALDSKRVRGREDSQVCFIGSMCVFWLSVLVPKS